MRVEHESMRVDENWRSNESKSCDSHPLSSSFDQALTFLANAFREKGLRRKRPFAQNVGPQSPYIGNTPTFYISDGLIYSYKKSG